ncbi:MAG TPA: hypothetical protein PLA94_29985, partial [Myxococcota bacterium]|nr:hypothetical protein [Myxococcota bacterium]
MELLGPPGPGVRSLFCTQVAGRLGCSPEVAGQFLDQAGTRAWDHPLSPAEKRSMAAWFGEEPESSAAPCPSAAARLAMQTPAAERLWLYDLLAAMAAVDGLRAPQLRHLFEAARLLLIDPVVSASILRRHAPRYRSGLHLPLDRDPLVI